MDMLKIYNEADDSSSPKSSSPRVLKAKSSTPEVAVADVNQTTTSIYPTQNTVGFNPTYQQLWDGPLPLYAKEGIAQGMQKRKLSFDKEFYTYQKFGYVANPSETNYVGNMDALKDYDGSSVFSLSKSKHHKNTTEKFYESKIPESNFT